MKHNFLITLLSFIAWSGANSQSKTIDTLIDVGNHKIHFTIIKGKGIPILFEAGGGNDGSVWNEILEPISKITNATLITYDRAGYRTSTIDTLETDESKHGIISSVEDLEVGLKKLGYDKEIILVSHSYGGYLSALYASRHPKLVKGVVLIDVNHNFYEDGHIEKIVAAQSDALVANWKKNNKAVYFMSATIIEAVKIMSKIAIPQNIPVIDFVSEFPSEKTPELVARWKECHKQYVEKNPNVTGIIARACHHGIWRDNPPLIITAISNIYANASKQKAAIQERIIHYNMQASNDEKGEDLAFNHSEEDLNIWGYNFLRKNENQKATEVFRLNMLLNPNSSNAYDSYAEGLLKTDKTEESILMYKKSLELNPENENAKKVLERLSKDDSKPLH